MSGRQLRGYAVKLVNDKGSLMWAAEGSLTSLHGARKVYRDYVNAVTRAHTELLSVPVPHSWRIRIVAIYRRTKRTAEQERADVVAWLRIEGELYRAGCIEQGKHVGRASK